MSNTTPQNNNASKKNNTKELSEDQRNDLKYILIDIFRLIDIGNKDRFSEFIKYIIRPKKAFKRIEDITKKGEKEYFYDFVKNLKKKSEIIEKLKDTSIEKPDNAKAKLERKLDKIYEVLKLYTANNKRKYEEEYAKIEEYKFEFRILLKIVNLLRVSQLSTSEKFTYPSIRFLLDKKLKLSDYTDKVKDTQFSKFLFNKDNHLFLNKDNRITPLMFACYLGKIDIVEELLKKNVRINTVDNQGRNALFYAIAGEIDKKKTKEVQELKSKIVDKLLNANINVKQQRKKEYVNVNNISKPDYVTAIDLAKSRGYSDIVEKLRSSISSQYKSGSFDLFGLFGGGNMQHKYNGRTYKVRVGPKGGKYIMVNKQKKYL